MTSHIHQQHVSAWEVDNIKVVVGESAETDRKIAQMYMERRSDQEIGKHLGICASSVNRRINRMIKRGDLQWIRRRGLR